MAKGIPTDTLFISSDIANTAIKGLINALKDVETKTNPRQTIEGINAGGMNANARSSAMNESRNRIARNDANARAKSKEKTSKRRIRTQAGARRYGGSIGDIIGKKKVVKGDTLSQMAKDYYGDASKWKLIAKANGIKDPKKLMPGTDIVFPPDPDNPNGANKTPAGKTNSGRSKTKAPAGSKRQLTAGEQRALDARADHKTYSDSDAVDLEATYYAPKNMAIEDVLKKFYGNTDRLDDVLKINGLDKGDDILAGQSLILPGIDPNDIYPSKDKRKQAKISSDKKRQGNVPDTSVGGAKAKATSHGYTLYSDGSVYGAGGWIVSATKKKAQNRAKAKSNK